MYIVKKEWHVTVACQKMLKCAVLCLCTTARGISLSEVSLQTTQIQKVQSTPESDIVERVAGF